MDEINTEIIQEILVVKEDLDQFIEIYGDEAKKGLVLIR